MHLLSHTGHDAYRIPTLTKQNMLFLTLEWYHFKMQILKTRLSYLRVLTFSHRFYEEFFITTAWGIKIKGGIPYVNIVHSNKPDKHQVCTIQPEAGPARDEYQRQRTSVPLHTVNMYLMMKNSNIQKVSMCVNLLTTA